MFKVWSMAFKVLAWIFAIPLLMTAFVFMWFYKGIRRGLLAIFGENRFFWFGIIRWAIVICSIIFIEKTMTYDQAYALGKSPLTIAIAAPLLLYDIGHLVCAVKGEIPTKFGSSQNRGLAYEHEVAKKLPSKGFHHIKVTKGSGDFGADIIAHKGFEKYAIQCKCYSGAVGVKAVQEAIAGKAYYDCDRAMVITNSTFTPAAVELAKKSHVELWDKFGTDDLAWIDRIEEMDAMLED